MIEKYSFDYREPKLLVSSVRVIVLLTYGYPKSTRNVSHSPEIKIGYRYYGEQFNFFMLILNLYHSDTYMVLHIASCESIAFLKSSTSLEISNLK